MSDNTQLNSGTGGDVIATDDIAGVKIQRVKIVQGADGANDGDVSSAAPLNVTLANGTVPSHAVTNAGTFAVQATGTVTANSGTNLNTSLLALESGGNLAGAATSLALIDNAVSGAGFNVTQLAGAAVPIGAGLEGTAVRVTLATDSTGLISVDDNGSALTVDNGGTFAVQESGGALTALQLIDDPIATLGTTTYTETTTKAMIAGALRRDADTSAVNTDNEIAPLLVDANGYLKVEIFDGGGSHTVDNGGTFAVQESGAALTALQLIDNAVSGAGFNITQLAGAAVPIGAGVEATAVRVTLATDSTGVVSVDDNGSALTVDNGGTFAVQESGGSLTALQLIDDTVATLGTTTYAEATTKGLIAGALRRDADTSAVGTDNEIAPLLVDANGYLKVEIFDGGGSHTIDGTVTANAGTNLNTSALALEAGGNLAASATSLAILDDWDETDRCKVNVISGQAGIAAGTGVDGVTVPRVTLATNVALPAGDNNIGNIDILTIAAGTTLIGDVGLSGARTSGGTTLFKTIDLDETEEQVKATAGQIYWLHAINLAATVRYLKIYNNTAAVVVVGTTVPDLTFPLPTAGSTNGAGFTLSIPNGIAFGTAITIAATTGIADNDAGAPGANEVVVNLGYA